MLSLVIPVYNNEESLPRLFTELATAGQRDGRPRSKSLVCGRYRDTHEEVMLFTDPRGTPIEVIRVDGNRIVVRPVQGAMERKASLASRTTESFVPTR